MSQSHPGGSDHHGDLDPLLAFNAELTAAESPANLVNPTPPAAGPSAEDVAPLRLRLDHAERSLDRARIEISALKSDLATLVTAVDDIKKRLSRRPEVAAALPPVPAPRRGGVLEVVGIALLCLTIGAAMWSLAPGDIIEVPRPQPIESKSLLAPLVPDPATVVPAAAVELATVANAVAPAPVQEQVERMRPGQDAYVGTLSIDAAPAGEVFINRRPAGRTPLRAENLRAGSHLIWIERDGYRRWTRVVAVAADRVSRVSAALDPLPR